MSWWRSVFNFVDLLGTLQFNLSVSFKFNVQQRSAAGGSNSSDLVPLALGDRHAVRTSSSSAVRDSHDGMSGGQDVDLNAGANLSVSRVQASDEGRYVCRAHSAFGRASASVAIFVQSERSSSYLQRALCSYSQLL